MDVVPPERTYILATFILLAMVVFAFWARSVY